MFGDLHNFEGRIKTIDKNLSVKYIGNGQYEVLHNKYHFMTVPREKLTDETIKNIREVVWKNRHADILEEVERNNNKIEASKQRDIDNTIESMAKEIRPLVRRLDY